MTFKVLNYNIKCGGNDRLSLIAEVIQAEQPDAVALVEANSQANAETLARGLHMQLAYGQANSAFAVAWISHLPMERRRNHRLKALSKTLLEVEVVWRGNVLSLYVTHLTGGRTAADADHRSREVQAILDVFRPLADRPHLLVGDFNAVHPGDPVGVLPSGEEQGHIARRPIELILKAGYVDCYRKLHSEEPGYTYTSHHPWLRLDHIFASPPMAARLSGCGVVTELLTKQASDHLPIWAAFN